MEARKIGLACFLGSFIGALIALQFQLFWGLGVLIGGAIGYVTYAYKEIPATAKKVWPVILDEKKALFEIVKLMFRILSYMVGEILEFAYDILTGSVLIITILLGIISLLNVALTIGLLAITPTIPTFNCTWWLASTFTMILGTLCLEKIIPYYEEERRKYQCVILACLPGISFLTLPLILIAVVLIIVSFSLIGSEIINELLWIIFKLVHSDIRLLCMTDSMIGATIGYFAGNALAGGIVGAMLGILNYQIISVRWLKLAPKQ